MKKRLTVWSYLLIALLVLMGLGVVGPVLVVSIPAGRILVPAALTAVITWTLPCLLGAIAVAMQNKSVTKALLVIGGLGIASNLVSMFFMGLVAFEPDLRAHPPIWETSSLAAVYVAAYFAWPILLFLLAFKEDQRLNKSK